MTGTRGGRIRGKGTWIWADTPEMFFCIMFMASPNALLV
jgi:hypothetical protein